MFIDSRYSEVADKFFELTAAQPYGGASCALYRDGEQLLNIWAGQSKPGVEWDEKTKSVIFSTSKGLLSILMHRLVESGAIDVDEKVATYWPEFAENGKERITVAMIMRHRSGLSAVREDLTLEDLQDISKVEAALARQKPIWEPDTGYLYHAGTIGQLLGRIIFNVTGKRVNQLLQEDLANPLGVEAYFGAPASLEDEIAYLKSDDAPIDIEYEMGSGLYWNKRAMTYGSAFKGHVDDFVGGYNDPAVHALEHAGAGGISNAASIAKIYSAVVAETDGVRLLSDSAIEKALSRPNVGRNVFNDPEPYPVHSLGFIVANPSHSPVLSEKTFGHDGLGGQQGFADLNYRIGFSYTTNWIPMVSDGMARHREITRVLKQIVARLG